MALRPLELATGQKIPAENRDDKSHIIFKDQDLQYVYDVALIKLNISIFFMFNSKHNTQRNTKKRYTFQLNMLLISENHLCFCHIEQSHRVSITVKEGADRIKCFVKLSLNVC